MSLYRTYKSFPKYVQSLATQHYLMEWLFIWEFWQEQPISLTQRLKELRKQINKETFIHSRNQHKAPAYKSLVYLDSEVNSRYWRLRLRGKPVVQKFKFSRLLQLINCQPLYPDKAFFLFLAQADTKNESLSSVLDALSPQIKIILLSKQARRYSHLPATGAAELSTLINRSCVSLIPKLCRIYTLDSLTALLIIAIYQQNELKLERPTYAEQCAFELFVRLFAIKYCPLNTPQIALGIAQKLFTFTPISDEKRLDLLKPNIEYFESILHSLSDANITLQREFKFEQALVNENIKSYDQSKYLALKELGFLIK